MTLPEWLKPVLYGAAGGAIALAVVGFSWGGWMTGSAAEAHAADRSRADVVAALVPICLEQSRQDPQLASRMAEIEAASSYQRRGLVVDAGWATMPGSEDADRDVANACMSQLAAANF